MKQYTVGTLWREDRVFDATYKQCVSLIEAESKEEAGQMVFDQTHSAPDVDGFEMVEQVVVEITAESFAQRQDGSHD